MCALKHPQAGFAFESVAWSLLLSPLSVRLLAFVVALLSPMILVYRKEFVNAFLEEHDWPECGLDDSPSPRLVNELL